MKIENFYQNPEDIKIYLKSISKFLINKEIEGVYLDDISRFDEHQKFEFDERIGKRIFWDKDANSGVDFKLEATVYLKIGGLYLSVDYDCPRVFNEYSLSIHLVLNNIVENSLLDISHYYSKNIVGQKVVNIISTSANTLDIVVVCENGYRFNINMWAGDSIYIYEDKNLPKNEVVYDNLERCYYEKYSILKKYINNIKNKFIGYEIENISRLGVIYDDEYPEKRYIELDEPIDIKIGNESLNIFFIENSEAYFGMNLFDYKETSSIDGLSWKSLNPIYKNNIIGQKVKDIILVKYDNSGFSDEETALLYGDKFASIQILLENNYTLEITNYHDYMVLNEVKSI